MGYCIQNNLCSSIENNTPFVTSADTVNDDKWPKSFILKNASHSFAMTKQRVGAAVVLGNEIYQIDLHVDNSTKLEGQSYDAWSPSDLFSSPRLGSEFIKWWAQHSGGEPAPENIREAKILGFYVQGDVALGYTRTMFFDWEWVVNVPKPYNTMEFNVRGLTLAQSCNVYGDGKLLIEQG